MTMMSSESAITESPWSLAKCLFPFAFVVDGEEKILHIAPRLQELTGAEADSSIHDHLSQVRPPRTFAVTEARARTGMLVTLSTSKGLQLRGQFLKWGDGVMFAGGPRVMSMEDVSAYNLRLQDFPPHDPRLDLLVLISTKDIALQDTRRLMERLQKVNAATEQRAEELSQELVRREAATSLGRLVAGVAHEVNTPLGVSLTALSVLVDSVEALESMFRTGAVRRSTLNMNLAAVRDAADLITANVQRAADLISNFKQVAVDQTHRQPREFELGQYVTQVVASLSPLIKGAQVQIEVLQSEPVVCYVDPGAVSQVIAILIENAVLHAFGPEGGKIQFELEMRDGVAILSCTDDGIGMDAETLRNATAPFFTTRQNDGGTGLGLFVLQRLVMEVFDSNLEIHSAPGEGTQIQLVLPVR